MWRTLPCPIPPAQRHKLQGVRLAGLEPLSPSSLVIQRKVSSRGGIQVARQRVQVGLPHAGRIVTLDLGDTTLRIIDSNGELLATVRRNGTGEISRFKATAANTPTDPADITLACTGPTAKGGGYAAAHCPARRAGYGAAPPAPRVLRIALRDSPAGCP